jgi:hypothetical protein
MRNQVSFWTGQPLAYPAVQKSEAAAPGRSAAIRKAANASIQSRGAVPIEDFRHRMLLWSPHRNPLRGGESAQHLGIHRGHAID